MHKVEIEELREKQLDILQHIADFCDRYEIRYWLDCGTLLGAIRHKGYIPWDDDIDIGMLRSDYDRFIKLYNQEYVNHKYKCCTIENTPKHYYGFAKIYDVSTVLYEPNKEKGRKISIYIDLFVYDNAPSSEKEQKKAFQKRDFLMTWYRRRIEPNLVSRTGMKHILGTTVRYCLQIIPTAWFKNAVINNMKRYSNIETEYVGNFSGADKMICSKSVFDKFIDVEFEGRNFKAPAGYDEWLKAFFGDYMKLPPEEKRVSHHLFEAYAED